MKCPNCGAETSNNVCEFCGSELSHDKQTTINITNNYYSAPTSRSTVSPKAHKKKSKIWLWILGWLFVFPLPLTTLILRKSKLSTRIKYIIIAIAWIAYAIMLISGASSNKPAPIADAPETIISSPEETPSAEDDISNLYAEDDIVNRFITDYNATSRFEILDISKGNIRTKYFGHTNDCRLEMINATDATADSFCVSITGGTSSELNEKMFEVFPEIIHVLAPSVTDTQIEQTISSFKQDNTLKENYALGDTLTLTFVPSQELSKGYSTSRIDISSTTYGK